jgi:threonine-phosphate decarboxylase
MSLKEFEHGGQVELFAKQLDCSVDDIIELSSNINFIKPKINIDFNTLDISAYPTYDKLYDAISQNYNIKPSQLELFNGGSNAIFTLFRFLDLKKCTIYSPAYLEYKKASKTFGYSLNHINRFEDILEQSKDIEDGSLVVFVNPSTPDGMLYDIDELMNIWIEKNCTVFIDESFLDFTDATSCSSYIEKYDRLYILKSMTKFYSSAGIRVGCIVSTSNNIKNLRQNEPAWKISQFDSTYLQAALSDDSFKAIAKEQNNINRDKLKYILDSSSLFEYVSNSKANYFLVKLKKLKAKQFQELLKPYKIMVRDCSNFDCLDDSYVRIAVKDNGSIIILNKAIKELSS